MKFNREVWVRDMNLRVISNEIKVEIIFLDEVKYLCLGNMMDFFGVFLLKI